MATSDQQQSPRPSVPWIPAPTSSSPRQLSPIAMNGPSAAGSLPQDMPPRQQDRPFVHPPTRASTTGSSNELEGSSRRAADIPGAAHARSEDLNHSPTSAPFVPTAPQPAFLYSSRPTTPSSQSAHAPPSSSDHTDRSQKRLSQSSGTSYSVSANNDPRQLQAPASVASASST